MEREPHLILLQRPFGYSDRYRCVSHDLIPSLSLLEHEGICAPNSREGGIRLEPLHDDPRVSIDQLVTPPGENSATMTIVAQSHKCVVGRHQPDCGVFIGASGQLSARELGDDTLWQTGCELFGLHVIRGSNGCHPLVVPM